MDVEDLRSGPFNTTLFDEIESSTDLVVILTPGSLDRCQQEGDWLRLEVAHAIKHEKNVVPVMTRGFDWPSQPLPKDIRRLPDYNALTPSHEYFEASMDRLMNMLVGHPRRRVLRPLLITTGVVLLLAVFWWATRDSTDAPMTQAPTSQARTAPQMPVASSGDQQALGEAQRASDMTQAQTALPTLATPSPDQLKLARRLNDQARSVANLKQLMCGVMLHQAEFGNRSRGRFLESLDPLLADDLLDPLVLISPLDRLSLPKGFYVWPREKRHAWVKANCSYVIVKFGQREARVPHSTVFAFEKFGPGKGGSAVAFEDGKVTWMDEDEARELIEKQTGKTIEALTASP
jgi:hypothetical protein